MPDPPIFVPFGDRRLAVPRPVDGRIRVALPATLPRVDDLDRAVAVALASPVGSPRLSSLAADAVARARAEGRPARAVVAVTDATRACPDDRLVPPILLELEAGGLPLAQVTVVVATGLHRPSTEAEKAEMLGPQVVAACAVVDHDATEPAGLVDCGTIHVLDAGGRPCSLPAVLSRLVVDADLVVATGVVEPHQYAGLSGGAKTVAIGLAGEDTIDATHGIAFLERPGVGLGRVAGNPFAAAVRELGRIAGVAFVVNIVPDGDREAVAVAAGAPDAVHDTLAALALPLCGAAVAGGADVVVAGVEAAKAASLYQASRAITYLHFGPVVAARPGGVYVLPAPLVEGAGTGPGERRFEAVLRAGPSPAAIVARLRAAGGRGGEQRAWLLARVLVEAAVVVVGAADPDLVRACGLMAAPTLGEGLELAGALALATRSARDEVPAGRTGPGRPLDLLVVPSATRTLILGPAPAP